MTYQEIQAEVKRLSELNTLPCPPLNQKKIVLEAALMELQALTTPVTVEITKDTIAPTTIEAPKEITLPEIENTATETATTTEVPKRIWINPEPMLITELKELSQLAELALVLSIAVVRSFIRFSTPYLIRGAEFALTVAIYVGVIFEVWLFPKIKLAGYRLGLWAVLVVIRIKNRRWVIA